MKRSSRIMLLRLILPLILVTLACTLLSPEETRSTSKRETGSREEEKEEKPTKTPSPTATIDFDLLSSPPPMDEETAEEELVAEEPIAEEPVLENTATPTNSPVPPTLTPTPLPSPTALPTKAPIFSWIPEVVQETQSSGYWANLKIDSQDNFHVMGVRPVDFLITVREND